MSTARVPRLLGLALLLCLVTLLCTPALPQATISTGAIAGTVTDATGAVVMGAKVTIVSKATGGQITLQTTGTGAFNSGGVIPGEYSIHITQTGFKSVEVPVTVQIGSVVSVDVKLQVGAAEEVMEVTSAAITVNTEQATVQGVLTTAQIDNLPINGRNFLDLAQLEPGVQIQDAMNFDPTKGGFTGISVGGRSGRTTRIEMDGLDVSDETVGTSVTNVSQSAIQEFSIQQSSLDLSTELTSSGAVNVVTRAGTNDFHGEAFYLFRGNQFAANFTGGQDLPYQRNHFGGRFGGPLIKDKLFFFLNFERAKQDLSSPVSISGPLAVFNGSMPTPYRESMALARLDWQIKPSARFFYRFNYDNNKGVTNYGRAYAPYQNVNNTPSHALGVDFTTGQWSHSVRVGYLKFLNNIGESIPPVYVAPGVLVRVGGLTTGLWSGPNYLAPQQTPQTNQQFKYDGSRMFGSHNFRYGASFNRIRGGGFASFYSLTPYVRGDYTAAAQTFAAGGPFPGGNLNPLNYPILYAIFGNGLGCATEMPAFGRDCGGQFDNRFQGYAGDTWKIKPFLTLTAGVRYVHDTGRTNSDLSPIPCSDINPDLTAAAAAGGFPISTCPTGGLIGNMWGKGLGSRVRQDNNNFGPNVGIAWDPFHSGKTVIRAGAGMYYENAIFNNVLFSRPSYLKTGLFFADQGVCPGGGYGTTISMPMGGSVNFGGCGDYLGNWLGTMIAIQNQYKSESAAAGAASNLSFLGNSLSPYGQGAGILAPNYRTPYSYQMNIGVQHQFWEGAVFTADYIRNVNLHWLVGRDPNHVGDARYFNLNAAQHAIAAVNNYYLCGSSYSQAATTCAITAGATMEDYAAAGLGSGRDILGGYPWYEVAAGTLALPDGTALPNYPVAFGGINQDVGASDMFFPDGRSVYNAMQFSFKMNKAHPFTLIKNINLQASYTLSRFDSMAVGDLTGDQDFIGDAVDNATPNHFIGPASFDRKHQFSVGMTVEMTKFVRLGFIQHIGSPLPLTVSVPSQNGYGEIFYTDFTGDGTTADIIPGTNMGSIGRSISVGGLAGVVNNYNTNVAGTTTPAGQALVAAGLMTSAQLALLGAVAPSLDPTIPHYAGNDWLNTSDLRMAFPIKIGERFTIEPTVSIYNLFNVANFNTSPNYRLGGSLTGSTGAVGYTANTAAARDPFRAFQSPGLYNFASPRQAEFELRITF